MGSEIECYRGVVYPWLCDSMGHMTTRHYTAMFDDASYHMFAALGFTPDHLAAGIGLGALAPSDYAPMLSPFDHAGDLPPLGRSQLLLDYDRDQAIPPVRALADLLRRQVAGAFGTVER